MGRSFWNNNICIFIAIFYFVPGKDFGSYENPFQATQQIMHNFKILVSIACSTLIIGPFNYYGTNLTKYSQLCHRCLIDASRMCFVWFISLCCKWEDFKFQQSAGYIMVLFGSLIYYEVIKFNNDETNNNTDETAIGIPVNEAPTLKVVSVKSQHNSKSFFYNLYQTLSNLGGNYNNEPYLQEEKDSLKDDHK